MVIEELRARIGTAMKAGCTCGALGGDAAGSNTSKSVKGSANGGKASPTAASISSSSSSASSAAVFPPALLHYQPPHLPGILGYTGALQEG